MRVISILILFLISMTVFGQSERKKKKQKKAERQQSMPVPTPSSLDPSAPQGKYEPKKSKRSSSGPTYDNEKEYYDRVAAIEKTRRKNERMMDKPQYSDPSYFGHKRPPKRRPPGKTKYCKECGLRH